MKIGLAGCLEAMNLYSELTEKQQKPLHFSDDDGIGGRPLNHAHISTKTFDGINLLFCFTRLLVWAIFGYTFYKSDNDGPLTAFLLPLSLLNIYDIIDQILSTRANAPSPVN